MCALQQKQAGRCSVKGDKVCFKNYQMLENVLPAVIIFTVELTGVSFVCFCVFVCLFSDDTVIQINYNHFVKKHSAS